VRKNRRERERERERERRERERRWAGEKTVEHRQGVVL